MSIFCVTAKQFVIAVIHQCQW